MRHLFLLLAAFLIQPASAQSVAFQTNGWETLLKRAKAEDKLIFVDVYTTWCGPCRWMDQNVFNNPQVGQFMNQNLLVYKADAEHGEGIGVARQFGVRAYPTALFVNGDGEDVYRLVGSRPAPKFLNEVRFALAEKGSPTSLKQMDKEVRQHRQDASWLREYLSKRVKFEHLDNGDLAESYLALLPADSLRSPGTLRLLSQVNFAPDSKAFETLLAHHAAAETALDETGQNGTAALSGAFRRMLMNQFNRAVLNQTRGPLDKALAANERIRQTAPQLSELSNANLEMTYFLRTQRFSKFLNLAQEHLNSEANRRTPESLAPVDSAGLAAFLKPYQSGQADSAKNLPAFRRACGYWQHQQADRYAADLTAAAQGCLDPAATPDQMALGMNWIGRAMEFGERSDRLATYAQLLHRLGRVPMAKRMITRAINRAYLEEAPDEVIGQLEGEQVKMNFGSLLVPGSEAPKRVPVGYRDIGKL